MRIPTLLATLQRVLQKYFFNFRLEGTKQLKFFVYMVDINKNFCKWVLSNQKFEGPVLEARTPLGPTPADREWVRGRPHCKG